MSENATGGTSATQPVPDVIRVMLVDDQDLVRVGLKMILESEDGIEVVAEATTGRDAIERAAVNDIDVICMDVQMPVMDGLEATRILVANGATAGILVLTTFDRDDYLFAALRAGASGFVLKNAAPESLIDAVQVIARGDALLAPDVTRRVIERFSSSWEAGDRDTEGTASTHPASGGPASERGTHPAGAGPVVGLGVGLGDGRGERSASFAGSVAGSAAGSAARDSGNAEVAARLAELTDREREVLELLAQGRSNQEIAGGLFVGEATVKTHVSKILMKLGLRDRIQAVVFAYENGIAVPRR